MRTRLLVIVVAASLFAATKPEDFPFIRPMSAPDSQSNEIAVFRFDGLLYRQTDRSFSNLRLFDEKAHEVPFLVRTVATDTTVSIYYSVEPKQLSFKNLSGNRMEIVFERDAKDSVPTELIINTPIANFENSVSVHGSVDRKEWRPLIENSPIYDYSRFITMRNTTVQFTREPYTYYRVSIDKVIHLKQSLFSRIMIETERAMEKKRYIDFIEMQEPFRIDAITFGGTYREVQYGKPQAKRYSLTIERVKEDTAENTTEIYCSSLREPLKEFALKTGNINFTRRALVEGTDDSTKNASWLQLGSNEVYSISIGTYEKKQLAISLGGIQRFARYRLKIVNGDNLPIKVDTVSALGEMHEGLFFHRGMKKVSLRYGGEKGKTPEYDISDILRNAPPLTGEVWQLGEQTGAGKPVARFTAKYLLTGALILMVLVLAGALAMTVKKVDEKTSGSGDEE